MAKLWKIKYQVKCNTQYISFPIDMLRYDKSIPNSQSDVHSIQDSIQLKYDVKPVLTIESITLIHYGHGNGLTGKKWKPTYARWESFGYSVISVNEPIEF